MTGGLAREVPAAGGQVMVVPAVGEQAMEVQVKVRVLGVRERVAEELAGWVGVVALVQDWAAMAMVEREAALVQERVQG